MAVGSVSGLHGTEYLCLGQNDGSFSQLRGLELYAKEINPPLCAVGGLSDDQHGDQHQKRYQQGKGCHDLEISAFDIHRNDHKGDAYEK